MDHIHEVPLNTQVWHQQDISSVLQQFESEAASGLGADVAAARLMQVGRNELEDRGGKNPLLILWEQVSSTMVLILIAAAVLSGILGKPLETVAIAAIVVLFAVLGFVQEYRAEKAMAALKKMSVPHVNARRNGQPQQIPATNLVPGDIILLEAGGIVPADIRVIESANLRIQEAALTGESEPVEKQTEALLAENLPLGDRVNMGYMGTQITYGRGVGVVVATGMQTELGRIATLIQGVESGMTPLQRQLDGVGKTLAAGGVLVAILIMIIGVLRGEPLNDMFLTAVSVAVAVVPEGLPAVVTLTLALGAQRMLRRDALIRKLPAVETLGSVTVICSDKTGTLTQNRMTVTVVDVAGQSIELTGTSEKYLNKLKTIELQLIEHSPAVRLALACGALCNDASLLPDPTTGRYEALGDPTEGALLVAASQAGVLNGITDDHLPRIDELPFDSERKRMTTVHKLTENLPETLSPLNSQPGAFVSITKGAPDGLIDIVDRIWVDDRIETVDDAWRLRVREAGEKLAQNGMRVLGAAIEWWDDKPGHDQLEKHMVFLGLLGMIDPPRPEVKDAVQTCKTAGIRPIMITGDHPLTARFIAEELGIAHNGRVKTGQMLVSVYARVSPEHKLRIVEALQQNGHVVAMTGDGVNDSPALKKADIGVAMGITGTDVSKEAAQMVLLNDNFATIVASVEEGRTIYDNIRRFVTFSIAGNLGKVVVMLFAPLFGINVAMLPLQLLWLNLMTDGLLGLGMGTEAAASNTMQQAPRSPKSRILSGPANAYITQIGGLIGVIALGLGVYTFREDNSAWQTMIFTSIAFMQIGQALASRSSQVSFFTQGWRSNPLLIVLAGIVAVLQLGAIYLPFLEDFFMVEALTLLELLVCMASGVLVFGLIEVRKVFLGKNA
jgi:Ca2+-transporting ATPase